MSDKIKTLSQAIRVGATFRPQCFHSFFDKGATCALGAAMEAVGLVAVNNHEVSLDADYSNAFLELSRRLPILTHGDGPISVEITNLNDPQEGNPE